ncbi:MAG: sulfate adenylyltransferase subunit 1 [Acidobacteriaceae bacterium]
MSSRSVAQEMQQETLQEQRFRQFLDGHLAQEMLRFTTAGSVDDGKSTLIGRLLHDTRSIYEDQLASIRASRVNRSGGAVDLSLLTDGLKAEREQGITIDVAYRYFSTARRKFILADTPGHEQYTRNMATGASTADVAIVLIDARAFQRADELLPQSRRHTYIASLLRIPHVVAAINKMDLVDYRADIFAEISAAFSELARRLGISSTAVIPVSALAGDNVVERSQRMEWYKGPTLLEYLETVPLALRAASEEPLRFPVQLVVRPNAEFRGYAGRVERGEVRPGMRVRALPSGRVTRVKNIITHDGELPAASFPLSVTLELEDEIDLSRGEMLVGDAQATPQASICFRAMMVWMHEQPVIVGQTCLIKHTTRIVRASLRKIRYRVDIQSFEHSPSSQLQMNDIAEVEFAASLPLFFDAYADNREMGALILIDPVTNATLGAAMILNSREDGEEDTQENSKEDPVAATNLRGEESVALVWLRGLAGEAVELRDRILQAGRPAVVLDDRLIPDASLPAAFRALQLAKVTAISARPEINATILDQLREMAAGSFYTTAEAAAVLATIPTGQQEA